MFAFVSETFRSGRRFQGHLLRHRKPTEVAAPNRDIGLFGVDDPAPPDRRDPVPIRVRLERSPNTRACRRRARRSWCWRSARIAPRRIALRYPPGREPAPLPPECGESRSGPLQCTDWLMLPSKGAYVFPAGSASTECDAIARLGVDRVRQPDLSLGGIASIAGPRGRFAAASSTTQDTGSGRIGLAR